MQCLKPQELIGTRYTQSVGAWQVVAGLEGMAEELTLSQDDETGEYTRFTRFQPGADTSTFSSKNHA